jgi:hypothetical protein
MNDDILFYLYIAGLQLMRFGVKRNVDAPIAIQYRAYTSRIWYEL